MSVLLSYKLPVLNNERCDTNDTKHKSTDDASTAIGTLQQPCSRCRKLDDRLEMRYATNENTMYQPTPRQHVLVPDTD